MASSESFFLFEVFIEDLKSYETCTNFRIKCQFQDVFKVQLRNPNDVYAESFIPKKRCKRKKSKVVVTPGYLMPSSQAAIVITDVESLISRMRQYPIELILWSKDKSCSLGLSEIPWHPLFIKYLQDPQSENLPSKSFTNKYDVFDEYTSRRMAIVTLKIKLTQVKDIPQDILLGLSSTPSEDTSGTILTTENSGTIKTIYSSSKYNFHKLSRNKNKSKEEKPTSPAPKKETLQQTMQVKEDTDKDNVSLQLSIRNNTEKIEMSVASLVRSQSDLNSGKLIALRKSKSYSSIEVRQRLAKLNNIFAELNPPLRSRVYWVEYFTVEKEDTPTASKRTSNKSSPSQSIFKSSISERTGQSPKGYFQFKVCASECKIEGVDTNPCFENICSTDLPEEAARLISLRKCTNVVECHDKKPRGSLLSEDKPLFIKMPATTYEKVEHVQGGMEAKMKLGDQTDPCYCTCECTFGFVKRSTFCKVCGGFEKVGEDIAEITTDPFPCPIYYNLDQKKKKKDDAASSSERTKKKSIKDEPEPDKGETKKTKKIVDDRFKFNYGYKGIRMYFKRFFFHEHCLPIFDYINVFINFLFCSTEDRA